jgi:predicted RNA binding protein YcfA (HicA-like mRNA interferase family)
MRMLKFKIIVAILESNGFVLQRQSGSHMIFRNSENRTTIVPLHGRNNEVTIGTRLGKEVFEISINKKAHDEAFSQVQK